MPAEWNTTKPPENPSAAERWYRLGAGLASAGRYHEALQPLEQALAYSVEEPDASFIRSLRSFYGVSLAMARGDVLRGRRLCQEAILEADPDVQLYVNLAQVFLRSNRKDLAIEVLDTALMVDPGNTGLRAMRVNLGKRRNPIFPFLDRGHPMNRYLGMVRHRMLGEVMNPA